MKYLLSLIVGLASLGLLGCSNPTSDKVDARVAALAYALDDDLEKSGMPSNVIIVIESDFDLPSLRRRLCKYPVGDQPAKVERDGSMGLIATDSCKKVAFWSIKVVDEKPDEMIFNISCVKGGLNGYGQFVHVKKQNGKWLVVGRHHTWVS